MGYCGSQAERQLKGFCLGRRTCPAHRPTNIYVIALAGRTRCAGAGALVGLLLGSADTSNSHLLLPCRKQELRKS